MNENIQPAPISSSQQPSVTLPSGPPRPSKKLYLSITVGILALLFIAFGILFFLNKSSNNQTSHNIQRQQPESAVNALNQLNAAQTQKQQQSATPTNTLVNPNSALLNYIPNFDHLQLEDLPNFSDVRSVYSYNNNKIIIGVNQIAEYNPSTKEFVRVRNPQVLTSIYSGALVGDSIFLTSDRNPSLNYTEAPKMYMRKIDANSGEQIKTYFKDDPRALTNLYMVDSKGTLWLDSFDGVMKINPSDDTVTNYSEAQLGSAGCHAHGIYKIDDLIKVPFLCNGSNVSIYDEKTDAWKFQPFDDMEWVHAINKHLPDFGLGEVPTFFYFSNKVNNKYYLFSDKGIYTLQRNGVPKIYSSTVTDPELSFAPSQMSKIYVTKNEQYVLLLGDRSCSQADPNCGFVGNLVGLQEGAITNLLENNAYVKSLSDQDHQRLLKDINASTVEESGQDILVNNGDRIIIRVNTGTKHIDFAPSGKSL
jgi:hypothetical protein